jgi:hypothetical protein
MATPDELDAMLMRLLDEVGVRKIEDYGWLDADTEDPNETGYVMWLLDPPYEWDLDGRQNDTLPPRAPTKAEQRMMELIADFFGLMNAARHSIGLAKFYEQRGRRNRPLANEFEFHELAGLVTLQMAADRIRDFFVIAVLHEPVKFGHEGDQFRLALCIAERKLPTVTKALAEEAARLDDMKKRRNGAMHRMALEIARFYRDVLEEDRRAYREKRWRGQRHWKIEEYDSTIKHANAAAAEMDRDIENRINALGVAYAAIARAANLAFQIEHTLRGQDA